MKLPIKGSTIEKIEAYVITIEEQYAMTFIANSNGDRKFFKRENVPMEMVNMQETKEFLKGFPNEAFKVGTAHVILDIEKEDGQIFFLPVASTTTDSSNSQPYELMDLVDIASILSLDNFLIQIFRVAEMINTN